MISIKDRIKAAKPRNNKVSWLNKKNKRARALHTTGVLPQASYGVEGTGYSPWIVRSLRTMAADSMGCAKQGRCPITAIALAKGIQCNATHTFEARYRCSNTGQRYTPR